MSKKLIAVASAAALALTGLVGIAPANATPASIVYTTAGGAGTLANPYTNVVPHANSLVAGTNALGIVVNDLVPGDVVSVTATGGAKVVGAAIANNVLIKVTDFGASSLTKTVSSGSTSASFWIYDTQVATASTIVIDIKEDNSGVTATSSTTKYSKATVGTAHAVTDIVTPANVAASKEFAVTFKLKDVFGNEIGSSGSTVSAAIVTTAGTPTDGGIATYDTSRKVYEAKMTSPANTRPFIITFDGGTDASSVGLGATALENIIRIVNSTDAAVVNTQVTTLTAQVAALTAQLAESRPKATSVTKKRYNTLARKWNAAFPSQKVALKK
jgi:hypothetical protein